ncbi:FadR/GntR family transcriptional regulator [Sporichthya brevicatena]
MTMSTNSLAPLMSAGTGRSLRSPKTAELVAATLRRMIVTGQLGEGDFLPHEAELMAHFGVSRPTLREAVRVLESERLVEVRRGSRTGAKVCVPGPEIVARPAGLLLELAGATVADVYAARMEIEPAAARLLAERGGADAAAELEALIPDSPEYRDDPAALARATAIFHRRMVELSGNTTLGIVAGMLDEITERATRAAVTEEVEGLSETAFRKMVRSYAKLVELVRDGDAPGAEAHWRRHMRGAGEALLAGRADTPVLDVLD